MEQKDIVLTKGFNPDTKTAILTNAYSRDLAEKVTLGKTVAGVAADGVPKDADVSKVYSITITASHSSSSVASGLP